MKKLMAGVFALGLLGMSSAAFAEGDQSPENIYTSNAAVTQQAAIRDAQARLVDASQHAVRPFTAAEEVWFEQATPETAE